jgi:hypothetical protein
MAGLDLRWAWLGALAFTLAGPALADIDARLRAEGWQEITFDRKTPNRFRTDSSGTLLVESDRSVSLIQMPIDVDLDATPFLSWRWRVEQQAPPSDLGVKGEDDRSLALYVAFPFVPEEASIMERMKRAVVEAVAGKDAPGRVLMYVWGGDGTRGDQIESPHMGGSGIITILRPATMEPAIWFDEAINIAEDYRRIFGSEPPDPISLAIGADTDDTMSRVRGAVTDINFIPPTNAS